jgi:hypothetical protein
MLQQPAQPFWMGDFPGNESWEVIQGDAFAAYIEMFCDCPDAVDISGWQFMLEIKESLDPDDPNVLGAVIWTAKGGECGVTALILIPAVTANIPDGSYAFDLKYRTPSGLVATIRRGEFNILPSTNTEFSLDQKVPPEGGGAPVLPIHPARAADSFPINYRQGYG